MSHRQRSQFALAVAVLVLVALAAACSSCATVAALSDNPVPGHNKASVVVGLGCTDEDSGLTARALGTGLVVGKHTVLTAAHMVECPDGMAATNAVAGPDGKGHRADVDVTLPGNDVALLTVEDDLSEYLVPVAIGPSPKLGDTVCEIAAWPRPTFRCGLVQSSSVYAHNGDIVVDMFVEHGNSGSPLYDAQGRLVGVVVMLVMCQQDHPCQTAASRVTSRAWIIPAE